jgi:hypothetical protein
MSTEIAIVRSLAGDLKSSMSCSARGSWLSMILQNVEPYCGYSSAKTSAR